MPRTLDNPSRERIAKNIQSALNERGWSQRELSRKADVTLSVVNCILTCSGDPSLLTLMRISKALDSTIDDLVYNRQPRMKTAV